MAAQNALYAKENRRPGSAGASVDYVFLVLLLLLHTVGLIALYSASCAQSAYDTGYTDTARYLRKQLLCAVIGLVAMVVLSRIPPKFWDKTAWPLYGISIVLLLCTIFSTASVGSYRKLLIGSYPAYQKAKKIWHSHH